MEIPKNELLAKLDEFTRNYYKNRLIRGFLWSTALLSALFLLIAIPEYLFFFSTTVRSLLFFFFVAAFLFVLIRLVLIPLFQLYKIGKIITYDQAATIIGKHFPDISDKLLNTLQLIRISGETGQHQELLEAGIRQKSERLKLFRFTNAIDFKRNYKYLKITVIPLTILILLAFFTPGTISEPANRILHFSDHFEKPLPFSIEILNKNFTVIQQQDFELKLKLLGEEIPEEVMVKTGQTSFKMKKEKGSSYSYLFKSLQTDVEFSVAAGDLVTPSYRLKVLPKPIILNFSVNLSYPSYTGKKNEVIENAGDLSIPEGTEITWNFFTKDVSNLTFHIDSSGSLNSESSGNRYTFRRMALNNFQYTVRPSNGFVSKTDSLTYNAVVVKDGFPSIFVTEASDSVSGSIRYFRGTIKDDYGFTKLLFKHALLPDVGQVEPVYVSDEIAIDRRSNSQIFYFAIDESEYLTEPGLQLTYFFEVWDNDGVNGNKAARTEVKSLSTASLEEIAKQTRDNYEASEDDLLKSLKDSKELSKKVNELNKKMVDQSKITWEEKKKLEDFIREAEAINKRIEEVKERNKESVENSERFLETSERIIEKQKMLNEMMDQLFSEELKKMIDELKKMMDQVDKEKLGNMLEKMKMSSKELENQLDRNLELMKQIEFDRRLEQVTKEMKKTAEDLESNAEKTEDENRNKEELLSDLEKMEQKADSLMKEAADLKKEGLKLEEPVDLGDVEKKKEEVKKDIGEGKEGLKSGQRKKSSNAQKKAGEQMKKMAESMENANMEAEEEQNEEDAENIRMILENLVRLSFEQEQIIDQTKKISRNDPKLNELIVRQKSFSDKMNVIADSLREVAKRQIMIKPVISKELADISMHNEFALEQFPLKNFNNVVSRQQFIMTAVNNLALLLNEALQKMNEDMMSQMQSKSGNKACSKPSSGKGGKKSAKDLKDLQGKIGEQLKKLKEGMDASKKDGANGKPEMKGMSKELAKLAAQQEALRNELQKYQNEMGEKGIKNSSGLSDAMREMEQIEKDLVNKRISQETIRRQQSIMTRLLESEKAEQTRDKEEKRESVEAKDYKKGNLVKLLEYKRKERSANDQLKLELPGMQGFYKTKVNNYFVKISE